MSALRRTIYFRGNVTAISALATSRPDDNFFSEKGSKDLPRLPRMGAKKEDTPPFYPGTQLRHLIREGFLTIALRANKGEPLPLEDHFMLIQGVPIGGLAKELGNISIDGTIEKEDGLRHTNPLIGLGGFWKFPGSLGVNDWLPIFKGGDVHYIHSKMRAIPHWRNPDLVDHLESDDVDRLKRIMVEDGEIARKVRVHEDEIKVLKKEVRSAKGTEKKSMNDKIAELEDLKKEIKGSKEGSTETLMRPVEGYEAFCPGTEFRSGMDISRCSELELGFVLYSLREIARKPYVGAHYADGKGEIAIDWEATTWNENALVPEKLGAVKISLLQFEISDEPEHKPLTAALKLAEQAIADPGSFGLDFGAYNPLTAA